MTLNNAHPPTHLALTPPPLPTVLHPPLAPLGPVAGFSNPRTQRGRGRVPLAAPVPSASTSLRIKKIYSRYGLDQ